MVVTERRKLYSKNKDCTWVISLSVTFFGCEAASVKLFRMQRPNYLSFSVWKLVLANIRRKGKLEVRICNP